MAGQHFAIKLSEFSLRLKCKQPDIGPDKMLGQNLTVRVELHGGTIRADSDGEGLSQIAAVTTGYTVVTRDNIDDPEVARYLYVADCSELPEGFGSQFLVKHLGDFYSRYPGIDLEIMALPQFLSISKREADIAVTLSLSPKTVELMTTSHTLDMNLAGTPVLLLSARAGQEASIEGLEAGSHVTAGDVKLPKGVELAVEADTVLAVINAAQSNEEAPAEDEAVATEGDSAE